MSEIEDFVAVADPLLRELLVAKRIAFVEGVRLQIAVKMYANGRPCAVLVVKQKKLLAEAWVEEAKAFKRWLLQDKDAA